MEDVYFRLISALLITEVVLEGIALLLWQLKDSLRYKKTKGGKLNMRKITVIFSVLIIFLMILAVNNLWADKKKEKAKKVSHKESEEQVFRFSQAKYKKNKDRLIFKGKLKAKENQVVITDSETGLVLGTASAEHNGKWRLVIKEPDYIPCRVKAIAGRMSIERMVEGSPENCGSPDYGDDEGNAQPGKGGQQTGYQIVAFNDLGMHCYDRDFSVFSILPPFNVIHAQVIKKGPRPEVLDDSQVEVYYSSISDSRGSINTTSVGKTNFWDYVYELFGLSVKPDEGLTGNRMPGDSKTSRIFAEYDPQKRWFTASGIPITAIDDSGAKNHYPMMRITAVDRATGQVLASTDIVLPVSDEMHCSDCHFTGGMAANQSIAKKYSIGTWSDG
ncbi:MAG: hypothetical protein D6710_03645, partial [Nitrospirae bacterium]